jgi:integrase/recombinase XerC
MMRKKRNGYGLVSRFCSEQEAVGKSSATIACYRSDLTDFFKRMGLRDVDSTRNWRIAAERVDEFLNVIRTDFKPATVNRRISCLRSFFLWGCRIGRIQEDEVPSFRPLAVEARHIQPASVLSGTEQANLVMRVTLGGEDRALALVALMLETGMRISEVRKLRWKDVRIEGGFGSISFVNSKSRRRFILPLPDLSLEALRRLRDSEDASADSPIFKGRTGSLTRSQIANILERYFHAVGLKDARPRILRTTYEANLIKEGVDPFMLAYLMGYSRLTAPQERYSRLRESPTSPKRRGTERKDPGTLSGN